MPRKSKLRKCVGCNKRRATIGALLNFYAVGVKRKGRKQITGSLPARGFCLDCFLSLAKEQGMRSEQRHELHTKLKPHTHADSHNNGKSHE